MSSRSSSYKSTTIDTYVVDEFYDIVYGKSITCTFCHRNSITVKGRKSDAVKGQFGGSQDI